MKNITSYYHRLFWILIITSISSCYNQKKSFQVELTTLLNEKYNITYLPPGFYDCSYEHYLIDGGDTFEDGYQMAAQCLPDFISEIKFSDKGAKMLSSFEDVFVLTCNKKIESYSDQIKGADYCKCLYSQYMKYEVGFDDLNDLEFTEGVFYQKMIDFCFVTKTEGAYFNRGYAKDNLEDYRRTIQDYNNAFELNPDKVSAYFDRGYTKGKLGNHRGAIQDYTKAIELDPEYALPYNNRGWAKYKLGDVNGGCLDWSKAGELGDMDAYDYIKKYCN